MLESTVRQLHMQEFPRPQPRTTVPQRHQLLRRRMVALKEVVMPYYAVCVLGLDVALKKGIQLLSCRLCFLECQTSLRLRPIRRVR